MVRLLSLKVKQELASRCIYEQDRQRVYAQLAAAVEENGKMITDLSCKLYDAVIWLCEL